jgi:hypothetical protein
MRHPVYPLLASTVGGDSARIWLFAAQGRWLGECDLFGVD